jgi:peptidoglycan hydrolase CwlO-like protein
MDIQTIVSVLVALVAGGVGKWILDAVAQHRAGNISVNKSNVENKISENEQAIKIYNDVIKQIKDELTNLDKKCEDLEKQYLETREENAILKAELSNLKRMVAGACRVDACPIKPLIVKS